MTLKVKLYFKNGVDTVGIVKDLLALPAPLRPYYFAEDEGKIIKTNVISDKVRFSDFRKNNEIGFFLYTKGKMMIDISTNSGYAEITVWLKKNMPEEYAHTFLKSLTKHNPIFGYACDDDEYDHRNRYYITIGKSHIQAWIGRRLENNIPGVYWCTLFSDYILQKYGVTLSDLADEAISVETIGDKIYLLQFYHYARDWKDNRELLDDLCERVSGIFSRRIVDASIDRKNISYLEFNEALQQWR